MELTQILNLIRPDPDRAQIREASQGELQTAYTKLLALQDEGLARLRAMSPPPAATGLYALPPPLSHPSAETLGAVIAAGTTGAAAARSQDLTGNMPPALPYGFMDEAVLPAYMPYPALLPLVELLRRWPPDQPDPPTDIPGLAEGSLERLDWTKPEDRKRAEFLRLHEVGIAPFCTETPGVF